MRRVSGGGCASHYVGAANRTASEQSAWRLNWKGGTTAMRAHASRRLFETTSKGWGRGSENACCWICDAQDMACRFCVSTIILRMFSSAVAALKIARCDARRKPHDARLIIGLSTVIQPTYAASAALSFAVNASASSFPKLSTSHGPVRVLCWRCHHRLHYSPATGGVLVAEHDPCVRRCGFSFICWAWLHSETARRQRPWQEVSTLRWVPRQRLSMDRGVFTWVMIRAGQPRILTTAHGRPWT